VVVFFDVDVGFGVGLRGFGVGLVGSAVGFVFLLGFGVGVSLAGASEVSFSGAKGGLFGAPVGLRVVGAVVFFDVDVGFGVGLVGSDVGFVFLLGFGVGVSLAGASEASFSGLKGGLFGAPVGLRVVGALAGKVSSAAAGFGVGFLVAVFGEGLCVGETGGLPDVALALGAAVGRSVGTVGANTAVISEQNAVIFASFVTLIEASAELLSLTQHITF